MSMLKRVAISVVMFLSLFGGFGLTAQAFEFPVNHVLYLDGYKDSGTVRMFVYVILSSGTLFTPATRYTDDKYYSYSLSWLNSKTVRLRIDTTQDAFFLQPGESVIDSVDLTYTSDKSGTINNFYSIHYQNGIEIDKTGLRNGVFSLVPVPVSNYTIATSSSPANGGTTVGGGSLPSGSSCTVTAFPNAGYRFSNWTEGWTVVSTSASYTFTVLGNRTLKANFTVIPPTLSVTPKSQWLSNDAGSRSFDIANLGSGVMAWTASVTSGGSWAKITSGASGSNAGKVTVGYDGNPEGGAARAATIRVVAPGAEGSPIEVTVSQNAGAVECKGYGTVGVAFELSLPKAFAGAEIMSLISKAKLPGGLKFSAETLTIKGIPAWGQTQWLSVNNDFVSHRLMIDIAALPAWAQGTFNGYVEGGGLATMSVTATGKITGKIVRGGASYAFSAVSYAGGSAENGFDVSAVAKAGTISLPLRLKVARLGATDSLGVAAGSLGDAGSLTLFRNVWKEEAAKLIPYIGYYTATLPGGAACGSGYLACTVDKAGKARVAGKLADGTAISLSGILILDNKGRAWISVYTAPTAYKGGGLFGLAEFVQPAGNGAKLYLRPLDNKPFLWVSQNPQATPEFGKGFSRQPGLTGGWYSKTEDLAAYYTGKNLTSGVHADADVPELIVGATRYESICWDPTGLVLTPVLKSGVMTGLSAPAAGKPVDPERDGVWDYRAENSVGLKIALTRATGLFKGSCLAWFDYTGKHTSKSVAFEGALTPVRQYMNDGVAGRGFFQWADKAVPPAPAKPYAFKWSYDFKILLAE